MKGFASGVVVPRNEGGTTGSQEKDKRRRMKRGELSRWKGMECRWQGRNFLAERYPHRGQVSFF
jgi:hypothetical protein